MSVVAAELKFFLSAGTPENDTDTSGGARSTTVRLLVKTNADSMNTGSGEQVKLTSDNAGDTQNVTLKGYGTTGLWLTETLALTGTTPAVSTNTFLHLCSVITASAATGIITVTGNTSTNVIHTIPAGESGARRLFLLATANATGGETKTLYEKIFIGNSNATSSLIQSVIWQLTQINSGALVSTIALECSGGTGSASQVIDGTESTANRLTAPTGGGEYTFAAAASLGAGLTVGTAADGNLGPGEYQGVWVKLVLPAGTTPNQITAWAPEIDGSAT